MQRTFRLLLIIFIAALSPVMYAMRKHVDSYADHPDLALKAITKKDTFLAAPTHKRFESKVSLHEMHFYNSFRLSSVETMKKVNVLTEKEVNLFLDNVAYVLGKELSFWQKCESPDADISLFTRQVEKIKAQFAGDEAIQARVNEMLGTLLNVRGCIAHSKDSTVDPLTYFKKGADEYANQFAARNAVLFLLCQGNEFESLRYIEKFPLFFVPDDLLPQTRNAIAELYLKGFKSPKKKGRKACFLAPSPLKARSYATLGFKGLFIKSKAAWQTQNFESAFELLNYIPLSAVKDPLHKKNVMLAKAAMVFTGLGAEQDIAAAEEMLAHVGDLADLDLQLAHPIVLSEFYHVLIEHLSNQKMCESNTLIDALDRLHIHSGGKDPRIRFLLNKLYLSRAMMGSLDAQMRFVRSEKISFDKNQGFLAFRAASNKNLPKEDFHLVKEKSFALAKDGDMFAQLAYFWILQRIDPSTSENHCKNIIKSFPHFSIRTFNYEKNASQVKLFTSEIYEKLSKMAIKEIQVYLGFLCLEHTSSFNNTVHLANACERLKKYVDFLPVKDCLGHLFYAQSMLLKDLSEDETLDDEERGEKERLSRNNLFNSVEFDNINAQLDIITLLSESEKLHSSCKQELMARKKIASLDDVSLDDFLYGVLESILLEQFIDDLKMKHLKKAIPSMFRLFTRNRLYEIDRVRMMPYVNALLSCDALFAENFLGPAFKKELSVLLSIASLSDEKWALFQIKTAGSKVPLVSF